MARTRASLWAILIAVMTSAALLALPFTPKARVHTYTACRGEVIRTVLLTGEVAYRQRQLCACAQDGRVKAVYVQPGQTVKAGELLMRMDTAAQEAALAELYRLRSEQTSLLASLEESVSVLAAQQQSLWLEQEAALRLAIESACIRAEMDGVVEAVYAEENGYAAAMSLLGVVRGEERCILASGAADETAALKVGAAGQAGGVPVILEAVYAPDGETGMQQLVFAPLSQETLAEMDIGKTETVEAVAETIGNCVPIPLSAVDRQNRVWYMENGRALCETVDSSRRSREAIAAPLHWEGRRVILEPEQSVLTESCAVREAERR